MEGLVETVEKEDSQMGFLEILEKPFPLCKSKYMNLWRPLIL
jgi:hypothetical protein